MPAAADGRRRPPPNIRATAGLRLLALLAGAKSARADFLKPCNRGRAQTGSTLIEGSIRSPRYEVTSWHPLDPGACIEEHREGGTIHVFAFRFRDGDGRTAPIVIELPGLPDLGPDAFCG